MGKITLPDIFSNGCVLQRNKEIKIWGKANPSSEVIINLTGDNHNRKSSIAADDNGCFLSVLEARPEGTDLVLEIKSENDELILTDISVGEVYLAGGQSNMEFRLKYDKDWEDIKKSLNNPDIHMFNVPQLCFPGHKKDTTGFGKWILEGEEGFELFSAPGYSFAKNIISEIDCPVGIISCNWGGSSAVSWIPSSLLENSPLSIYLYEYEKAVSMYSKEEMDKISLDAWTFEDSAKHGSDFEPLLYGLDRDAQLKYMKEHAGEPVIPLGPYHINRPGGLYKEMLEPIMNFAIRGVLWYQGETDCNHSDIYDLLMTAVINNFRTYQGEDMPFLFVQLAPFGIWLECTSFGYTELRAAQEKVSKTVPYTYMSSIMDLGLYYDIHPKTKQEVGRRLALLALKNVYGMDIVCNNPSLKEAYIEREHSTIVLCFNDAEVLKGNGLITDVSAIQNGGKKVIAKIDIDGNKVRLIVPSLEDASVHIELGWGDFAQINIFNEANLPLLPFSTDIR